MSERTYKIAAAILDSAQEEYRSYNLENAERVSDYAYNAMDIVIGDEEAEAILSACKEYLSVVESDDFNGEGQLAWDRTIGALKDFETRGGKREGAGRKPSDTYDIKVRLTATQHETLKKLGGSVWLQEKLNAGKNLAGNLIVIDIDFKNCNLMTPEEVENLKNDWGETVWNESGPYVCETVKEAIALIADQIECEIVRDEPDTDKIETLNDVLKEITNLM